MSIKYNDQIWNNEKQILLRELERKCFIDGYVCSGIDTTERAKLYQEASACADEYVKFREGK